MALIDKGPESDRASSLSYFNDSEDIGIMQ